MCSLHVNDANFGYIILFGYSNNLFIFYFRIELLDIQLRVVLSNKQNYLSLLFTRSLIFLEKGSAVSPSTLLPDACHLVQLVDICYCRVSAHML
jgi:hypothetical protein